MTTEEIIKQQALDMRMERDDALAEVERVTEEIRKWKFDANAYADWINTLKAEVEQLTKERDDALAELKRINGLYDDLCAVAEMRLNERERALAQVEQLKKERDMSVKALVRESAKCKKMARENTRKEPSRLEIAAMAMQGMLLGNSHVNSKVAVDYADALIAAAKEGK
jgi:chromosome segregation ATPase